jgi:two-component sensor histidine kinase
MLLELCYKSLGNLMMRKKSEAESNQRLLDKQDRIESIAASYRASSGDIEDEVQLQDQLQDIQDMVSSTFYSFPEKHYFTRQMLIPFRCPLRNANTLGSSTAAWTSSVAPSDSSTRPCSF